jgi:hypothetical protein
MNYMGSLSWKMRFRPGPIILPSVTIGCVLLFTAASVAT